jgi:predicted SAM-dependent methyltransferase
LRELVRELRYQGLHRSAVRKAARLPLSPPPKLNLGCGENVKPGWLNVDLFKDTAELRLDLPEPFPFPDGSIAFIYSEHMFEHLSYPQTHDSMGETSASPSEALQLLRESFRVLVPGGTFSVGVPDAERAVALYDRRRFERWGPPWVDRPMHFLNCVFRQGREHKYAYDEETVGKLLGSVGFVNVVKREFSPGLDSEHRRNDTLYMEAIKPEPATGTSPASASNLPRT